MGPAATAWRQAENDPSAMIEHIRAAEHHAGRLVIKYKLEIENLKSDIATLQDRYRLLDLAKVVMTPANENDLEIERLRAKNAELNRRWQLADQAFREAKKALEGKFEWRGGNFGRAILAYDNSQKTKRIAELESKIDLLPILGDSKNES